MSTRPGTKLVIIDSVSMPLRVHSGARDKNDRTGQQRAQSIGRVAAALTALVKFKSPEGHGIHVVTTNHMIITRQGSVSTLTGYPLHPGRINHGVGDDTGGGGQGKENYTYGSSHDSPNFKLAPYGGETMSAIVNTRLVILE